MKFIPKNRSIKFAEILQTEPRFLQTGNFSKLSSLIYKDFLKNGSSHAQVCSELLQSGKPPNKSTTYGFWKFACRTLSLRERDKPRLRGFNSLTQTPLAVGSIGVA